MIKAGALSNMHDLVVSPEHRLSVYQRQDKLGTGRAETLVRAKHLVNGKDVYHPDDGFGEYYQLLFDEHQIIYAEGIAAESLLLDPVTEPALPRELLQKIADAPKTPHDRHGVDVARTLLDRPDAVELLKRASLR